VPRIHFMIFTSAAINKYKIYKENELPTAPSAQQDSAVYLTPPLSDF
jgi:hypothetical protein